MKKSFMGTQPVPQSSEKNYRASSPIPAWHFFVPAASAQSTRDAVFLQMRAEGLLSCAMSGTEHPTLRLWRSLTSPRRAWLLLCAAGRAAPEGECASQTGQFARICGELGTSRRRRWARDTPLTPGALLGAALLTPWRGHVWEFDFTCFRQGMPWAIPMARQALQWIFTHAPVRALWGLCPRPNAHAWRLAERAGFQYMGVMPKACWWARRQCFVDGILFFAGAENFVVVAE